MKQRYVRPGDQLTDDTTVVVRGGPLDPQVLREDAVRMFDVYGIYGVSVFAVREVSLDELAQQAPLVRFAELTLAAVGAVRAAGLGLEATGRNPQHFTVVFPDVGAVDRLVAAEHRTMLNPYHEA